MRDGGEGLGARASVPRRKVDTSTTVNMGRRNGPVFTGSDDYLIMGIPAFKYSCSTPKNIYTGKFQTQDTCMT